MCTKHSISLKMIEKGLQFDFENCSDAELKQWLQETGPLIIKFLAAAKRFCNQRNSTMEQSLCKDCTKHGTCTKLCEVVKSQLPGVYEGSGYKENSIGLDLNYFQNDETETSDDREGDHSKRLRRDSTERIQKITSLDIFEEYEESVLSRYKSNNNNWL